MNGQPGFWRLAFRQFWLLFGSVWLLVGGVFLVVGGVFLLKEHRYRNEGVVIQAEVVDKFRRSGGNSGTRYAVQYQFTTPQGQILDGDGNVRFSVWDSLKEGDRVAVEFLRSDPESNRLQGDTNWLPALVFSSIGVVFAPIGGFLVGRSVFKVRRSMRLMREGVRVEATVVSVAASNVTINDERQWLIRYAFRDHFGQTREAESDYMSPAEAARWKAGDTGVVRYDQSHPALSIWLGREESM
jgi:hypothetical protein